MEAPGFWDDAEAAQEKSKLLKGLKDDVETCAHLYQQYEDIETLIQTGYEENDEGGTFYPGDDEKSYSSYGIFVNAWMPLPEPYKEGEDE